MMENQLLVTLSRNNLLKNVDISKINLRGIIGRLVTIGEGEILFREGDPADYIYLVISGEINVLKKRLLGRTKSLIFTENDFFGHDEYFEETSRTSTAVALRDCYLITLSRDEVDRLIQQDNEIIVNLREPVAELDDDSMNGKTFNNESIVNNTIPSFENIQPIKEEVPAPAAANKFTNDFEADSQSYFNSISDVSRSGTDNLIQPLSKPIESVELPEDKVVAEKIDKPETNNDFPFNEFSLFNEDGIPKAEFELPENADQNKFLNQPITNSQPDFDDAMFSILSGSPTAEIPAQSNIKEPEPVKNSGDPFFASFSFNNETGHDKEKLETPPPAPISNINVEPKGYTVIPSIEEVLPKEVTIARYPRTTREYGAEDIFEEADKKLKQIEDSKQPVQEEIKTPAPTAGKEDDKLFPPFSEEFDKVNGGKELMSRDELEMIIHAAEVVNSSVRIDEALRAIVDVATEITSADRGTLYLVDKEKGEIWSLVALGEEMKEIRLKIGEGLAGYVAKTGETINIPDVQRDPRFKSDYDRSSGYKTKNMICFPIQNRKSEIQGVLQLLNSSHGEFTKRDEEFLNALSVHAAIAIQNAELVEKLMQTERVQSLGKMANFLIQDIKKPVLVSKRYAEHLLSKKLAPDAAQVIEMLLEQLTSVADIVQTTSSYSEGKTILRTLTVSINSTLADYQSRIDAYVENRNCKVISEYDKDATVKLDVKEFFQTYMHIVKNACDAMPDGGTINVSTKRDDKKVKISIRDTGLGIPEGFKDKIFEPFMSYGKKEGTGLGLSITKKIIEAHNGKIEVESTVGQGSNFIITIPISSTY